LPHSIVGQTKYSLTWERIGNCSARINICLSEASCQYNVWRLTDLLMRHDGAH
jgi:hypothetical protein